MTITASTAEPDGLADLKHEHRAAWASGDYAHVAERLVGDVIPAHVLDRAAVRTGARVLDLAAGTGNIAVRAAQAGARVTALDLAPELLQRGRERAAAAGVEIEWVEGDAEDLPFEDGRFDCVLSTLGIQFAPRHVVAASEAVRVTRSGGTIGLANWTPRGHIGQVLRTVGAHTPRPPAFASPPALWGDEDHVRSLLEPHGVAVECEPGMNPFTGFASADEWVDYMAANYGPLLAARRKLALTGGWDDLRAEIVALTEAFDRGRPGELHVESEYLLVLGTVR
jgi:SAM-dependent methyltransferase